MKTISEIVEGLNQEELKDFAVKHLDYLANTEVMNSIVLIWDRVKRKGDSSGYRSQYELLKQRLEKLDLWNSEYEKHYTLALKGELNLVELNGIQTK